MPEPTSAEQAVTAELRALRRRSDGLTTSTISAAQIICRLLGNGDPALAYTRLQHHILDNADDRTIKAAAVSLGLLSDSEGVLGRLEDGGQELFVEQRQVRRLSDEGIARLATLISTNWLVEASPVLTVIVISAGDGVSLAMHARHPLIVEMSEPQIAVYSGDEAAEAAVQWRISDDEHTSSASTPMPLEITIGLGETSVAVTWRGEVWPKMECRLIGAPPVESVETLGNRIMVRFARSPK